MLESGFIWLVGDGRRIDIFKSKWLKKVPNGRLSRQGRQNSNLTKVEELIVNDSRVRND